MPRLGEVRGPPVSVTADNGPEFAGKALDAWTYGGGAALSFIRPGEPVQNAYIESFNGRFRDECLNAHWGQVFTPDPQISAERFFPRNQRSQLAIQANIPSNRNVRPLLTCLS
jgi:transposase InsO family protein